MVAFEVPVIVAKVAIELELPSSEHYNFNFVQVHQMKVSKRRFDTCRAEQMGKVCLS